MGIVPFKQKQTPAKYAGASGPHSKGRMPQRMTVPSIENDSGPDARKTLPVDAVDGAKRGHDTSYPKHSKQQT